jgi:hypothetical protein
MQEEERQAGRAEDSRPGALRLASHVTWRRRRSASYAACYATAPWW